MAKGPVQPDRGEGPQLTYLMERGYARPEPGNPGAYEITPAGRHYIAMSGRQLL
jgi:hypothetical protein